MSLRPSWLGARRSGFGATLTSLALAISCGLSPVDDLPSAVDGFNVDGVTDGSDGPVTGAGGAASGSGGAPCTGQPVIYECRGDELWSRSTVPQCAFNQTLLEVCSAGCQQEVYGAGCNLGGAAGATNVGGAAGSDPGTLDGQSP